MAWRLCEARWAETAFSGEGARRFGGRWNSPGTAVVYTSESRALAVLEQLVHVYPNTIPTSLVLISVDVPDGAVEQVSKAVREWLDGPEGMGATTSFGNQWLSERRSVALAVPSAVVSDEFNVLLNPNHPDIGTIVVGTARPFRIDPRLLRASST